MYELENVERLNYTVYIEKASDIWILYEHKECSKNNKETLALYTS